MNFRLSWDYNTPRAFLTTEHPQYKYQGSAPFRVFAVSSSQYCCGLHEIGCVVASKDYLDVVIEAFKEVGTRGGLAYFNCEVILPLSFREEGKDTATLEFFRILATHLPELGFKRHGDEWYNPNTGHMLQRFLKEGSRND